ncbi:hypothetical protein BaRGS_00001385 [Batillaria attramentaria]|uniref:Multiple inositol polyphosphate phosphatase 1 n=1 Tax=Batillaria attramentaria TaxID=370345 RepID=A0ABD0M7I1_9CAEN
MTLNGLMISAQAKIRVKMQFAFGHVETSKPFYIAFGLFNDTEPLTKCRQFQKQEQRQFRTSHILPFGANLQLILYECEPPEQYLDPDEDHVLSTTRITISSCW